MKGISKGKYQASEREKRKNTNNNDEHTLQCTYFAIYFEWAKETKYIYEKRWEKKLKKQNTHIIVIPFCHWMQAHNIISLVTMKWNKKSLEPENIFSSFFGGGAQSNTC